MEPIAAFVGRLGAVLVRVRADQRGVDIDDHLTTRPGPRPAGQWSAPRPHCGPSIGARVTDRSHRGIDLTRQGRDQSRHRRIGGNGPEDRRLGTDRGNIGQTVPAERDRDREIEQHLARHALTQVRRTPLCWTPLSPAPLRRRSNEFRAIY